MEDRAKQLTESVEDMLKGLQGIVSFAEQSTKGVFDNLGKAEAKKFAKQMNDMKFSDNILNLKKEVEGLKKAFNQMK